MRSFQVSTRSFIRKLVPSIRNDVGVVEKAVEDGGGNGAVAVEDCGPLLEGFVGGEHDGAALVALADRLEEEVCAALIDGKITDLVKDKDGWGEIFTQLGFENTFVLCGGEGVDHVDSVGEENGLSAQACGVTKGRGEMGFSDADQAEENDVGFVFDKRHCLLDDSGSPSAWRFSSASGRRSASSSEPQSHVFFTATSIVTPSVSLIDGRWL